MKIVVVALGKIGLPLAAFAAKQGHEVVGCDISQVVVDQVNSQIEPFPGEAGLAEALAEVVPAGRLRATTDTVGAVADGADLIIVVPPLVVDKDANPEWRAVDSAIADVAQGLKQRKTQTGSTTGPDGRPPSVVVETTLPVGSTRGRIAPAIASAAGLEEGLDFYAAHSPERVYSGRIFEDLVKYPKLVGALSADGEAITADRYRTLLGSAEGGPEVRELGGAEAAELAKLAETTYRDLNIAFANELAVYADRVGVDINEVIDAANSQPFSHIHRPGVAVGGHCIPVYPRFYLAGDPEATLPRAARAVNEEMPKYTVDLLERMLQKQEALQPPRGEGPLADARILILGVAYRGNVKETAFSGAFPLAQELAARGAVVFAHDPLYSEAELRELGIEPWDGGPIDGAIVQADHAEYAELQPADLHGVKAVVDGRGILDITAWNGTRELVKRIGRDSRRVG